MFGDLDTGADDAVDGESRPGRWPLVAPPQQPQQLRIVEPSFVRCHAAPDRSENPSPTVAYHVPYIVRSTVPQHGGKRDVIHTRGLTKQFKTKAGIVEAVRGIDVDVAAGELVAFLGPNGAGKSTTLRMVAGLEEPTSGRILFAARDVTRLEPRDRNVAMVFQNYALYPHMSVRGNLEYGLRKRRVPAAQRVAKVREIAAMLQIDGLLDRKPRELSGGQRQRVALGRAPAVMVSERICQPSEGASHTSPVSRASSVMNRSWLALPIPNRWRRTPADRALSRISSVPKTWPSVRMNTSPPEPAILAAAGAPLRIAHLTATFPPYPGGAGNTCYRFAKGQAGRGHHVEVFTAPADGAYTLVVSSKEAFLTYGPRYLYTVRIAPEEPDFRVVAMPMSNFQTDSVVVGQAGHQAFTMFVQRSGGFTGDITVSADKLPPGLTMRPQVIAGNQKQSAVVVSAAPEAPPGWRPRRAQSPLQRAGSGRRWCPQIRPRPGSAGQHA